jgi:hypothetical protein
MTKEPFSGCFPWCIHPTLLIELRRDKKDEIDLVRKSFKVDTQE